MRIHQRKLIFPALLWLGLYLLLNIIIGNAVQTNQELYVVGAIPQLILALFCLLYLYRTGLST